MKKFLISGVLFFVFSLSAFADSKSNYENIMRVLNEDDRNLTRQLAINFQNYFFKDKEMGKILPVGLIWPENNRFKQNTNVYAFFQAGTIRIVFKEKISFEESWLGEDHKFALHNSVHEMTHFYQYHYGERVEGGTPDVVAMKMLEIMIKNSKKNPFIKNSENPMDIFCNLYNTAVAQIKNDENLKKEDNGWNKFKKGAIAEGTACLMGMKVSGKCMTGKWDSYALHYMWVFLSIYLLENKNVYPINQTWGKIWKIHKEKIQSKKYGSLDWWEEYENSIKEELKNITENDILRLIERKER